LSAQQHLEGLACPLTKKEKKIPLDNHKYKMASQGMANILFLFPIGF
jgi:hypothetical protein